LLVNSNKYILRVSRPY